jgi:hypothetical protein
LSARRPALAAVAIAAVGALRLRRALTPLIQRTLAPDNPHWQLSGWAAGELGTALVRASTRLESGAPERLSWALAHAIRRGAAREVERARTGANTRFLDAATQALNQQDEVRNWHEALRRGEGDSAVARALAPIVTLADTHGTGEFRAGL